MADLEWEYRLVKKMRPILDRLAYESVMEFVSWLGKQEGYNLYKLADKVQEFQWSKVEAGTLDASKVGVLNLNKEEDDGYCKCCGVNAPMHESDLCKECI